MKKLLLTTLLAIGATLTFAEIPAFSISEQSASQQNRSFSDRLNASQKLVWVLPSNYFTDPSKTYWDNITGIFYTYYTQKGLKIVYYHTAFNPASNMSSDIPGKAKKSYKDISYDISNQKFYNCSDLIVFPELYADGFSLGWKLTFVDVYQNLSWSADLKLSSFSNEKQIVKNIEKRFPYRINTILITII